MHTQRIAMVSVAGAGILATFLPWVHLPLLGSIAGSAGDGWITLVLYLPALIVALLGDRSAPRTGGALWGAVVPGLLASLLAVWKIVDVKLAMSVDDNPIAQAMMRASSIGIGLYLAAAAGIVLALLALRLRGK